MIIDQFQNNYVIENFPDRLKVTIHGGKKWGWFLISLFPFLMFGVFSFPVVIFLAISAADTLVNIYPVTIIVGILLVIIYIHTMRRKFRELMDYIYDKEVIEVDEHQIKVERSGFLGLKTEVSISAENVNGITGSLALRGPFNAVNLIPFTSSALGSVVIWTRKSRFRPFYFYGKGLSPSDALVVIDAILQKFPKYRYTEVLQ